MEDWDEDHILWNMGDGDPWYCFPSCEVKENEDYEILDCWVEGVKGTGEGETVTLDQPIMTDKLVITILDAVKGEKWEDTCISEIRVF